MTYPLHRNKIGLLATSHPLFLTASLALSVGAVATGCGGGDNSSTGGSAGSTTSSSGGTGGMTSTGGSTGGDTSTGGSTGGTGGSTGGTGGMTTTGGTGGGTGGTGGSIVINNNFDCTPSVGNIPPLKATTVASGFTRPIAVRAAAGDDTRLYVAEQTGKIKIILNGTTLPEPFLDIQSIIANPETPTDYHQEQGLIGIAFHPNYANNGRFFVHYSEGPWDNPNPKGDGHIVEYKRSAGDPNKADPNPVKEILFQPQPYFNHNGGNLEFSPVDGFLYIGFGDGGAAGDPDGNGQNMNTWLGKMLRIDVDSGNPYSVPPGNMPGGKPEIWDLGLRNPWRYSFDGCTGDLYIGDVGQNAWEEIDIEPAGQGGKNYGWKIMEGTHCYSPMNGCNMAGITQPVTDYDHVKGTSVTGGYVYRGSKIPALRGYYFYADYTTDALWIFKWDGGPTVTPVSIKQDVQPYTAIVSFGQDNHGEIYMAGLYGSIYRIDPE